MVVPTSNIEKPTYLSVVALVTFLVFFGFSFCQRDIFRLGTILSNYPKLKV
jgi:hypothetical protein